MGGKPKTSTPADKRLKANKGKTPDAGKPTQSAQKIAAKYGPPKAGKPIPMPK